MGFFDLVAVMDSAVLALDGGPATYAPGVGSPVTLMGVFDQAYILIEQGQVGVSSQGPAIFFRLAALPSDPTSDTAALVTVLGVTYRIREAKPDGQGGVLLLLNRNS